MLLLDLLERNAPCEPFDSYFVFWHSLSFRRKKITIIGKLTRVMAIGGETSGWSVEFKHRITLEGKKVRSVEVSGPLEELEKLKD